MKRTGYQFLTFLRSSALMYRPSFSILICFVVPLLNLIQCHYLRVPCYLNLELLSVRLKVYFYLLCEINITKLCETFSAAGYEKYVNVRHCHENIIYLHSSTDSLTLWCLISRDLVNVCQESAKRVGTLRELEVHVTFLFEINSFCVRSVKGRRCNENISGQDDVYWWCPQ